MTRRTPERPRGTCTVEYRVSSVEQTLKVTYDPAPEDPGKRMEWLGDTLFPDAVTQRLGCGRSHPGGPADDERTAAPPPWWHPRRLPRPVPAAAVAGALLGGTAVAWQTDAGPFAADKVCWDALDRDALSPIIEAPDELDAEPPGRRASAGRRTAQRHPPALERE